MNSASWMNYGMNSASSDTFPRPDPALDMANSEIQTIVVIRYATIYRATVQDIAQEIERN